jgi:hypothetical protein
VSTRTITAAIALAEVAQEVYDRDIRQQTIAMGGVVLSEGDRLRAQAAMADSRDDRARRLAEALRLFQRAKEIDNRHSAPADIEYDI